MRGLVYLFLGVVFFVVAIILYFKLETATMNTQQQNLGDIESLIKLGIPGLMGFIGLIFTILGLKGVIKGAKRSSLNKQIMQMGVETEAEVTYVNQNFSMLVNHRPIYSIVEYKYQDSMGNEHVRKIENLKTDLVIRSNIQVGNTIKVKYLPNDPSQSVMLF